MMAEKLSALNGQIADIKKIDQDEADLTYLKDHIYSEYKSSESLESKQLYSFYLSTESRKINYSSGTSSSVRFLGIGSSVFFPVIHNLNLRLNASLMINSKSEDDARNALNTAGLYNEQYYGYGGYSADLGLAYLYDQFTFSAFYGTSKISYKSLQTTPQKVLEKSYSASSNYYGVGIRYGKKYFIEAGPMFFIRKK